MVIEVNKDIDRYQESVAMGLTARQLIFSIASVRSTIRTKTWMNSVTRF